MHITTINNKTHGDIFDEKFILLRDIVGILLTIKKPMINKLNKFK